MTESRNAFETVRSTVSTATSDAADAFTTLALVAAAVGWTLFGLNLARIHYLMGDASSAVFSGVVAVAPLIGIAVYYGTSFATDLSVADLESKARSN